MLFAQLITKERNDHNQRMQKPMREAPTASSLPTPSEVMKLIGMSKFKKAVGEDLLGGDFFWQMQVRNGQIVSPVIHQIDTANQAADTIPRWYGG